MDKTLVFANGIFVTPYSNLRYMIQSLSRRTTRRESSLQANPRLAAAIRRICFQPLRYWAAAPAAAAWCRQAAALRTWTATSAANMSW